MEKAKEIKNFPTETEYTRLTFEKCIQSITGSKRTDRARKWMLRYLKDDPSFAGKGTWFHKKEVPPYRYAKDTSRWFVTWKQAEIARAASTKGKHGVEVRRKKSRERLQKDEAAVSVVAYEALKTGKTTEEKLKKAGIIP